MTNDLLKLTPNHERALGNKKYYEKELAKQLLNRDKQLRGDDGSQDNNEDQVTQLVQPSPHIPPNVRCENVC